jgi:hypothetical protein
MCMKIIVFRFNKNGCHVNRKNTVIGTCLYEIHGTHIHDH